MKEYKVEKFLKYQFSDKELSEHSKSLAREVQDMTSLESAKKEAMTGFTAQIEAKKAEIGRYSRYINNGHEYRNIQCEVTFHTPKTGWKQITRKDTGEVVEEIAMTTSEMQEQLQFDAEAAPPIEQAVAASVLSAEVVEEKI